MTTPQSFPAAFRRSLVPASLGHLRMKEAFTLMELLVTVGIISVLAAILLPAVAKMRAAGQGVQCIGNLRALGQVCLSFTQDHNGNMPQGNVGQRDLYWFDQLSVYEGRGGREGRNGLSKYMGCPSVRSSPTSIWRTQDGGRAYDINYRCGWSQVPPHFYVKYGFLMDVDNGRSVFPTGGPSKAAWFMDPRTDGNACFDYRNGRDIPFRRDHNKKTNVLFFDGHAAAVEIPDFQRFPSLLNEQQWVDFFGTR